MPKPHNSTILALGYAILYVHIPIRYNWKVTSYIHTNMALKDSPE